MVAPMDWTGDDRFSIPGSVDGEVQREVHRGGAAIYESGDSKPVAFSSAASIMLWTLMNARNGKESLLTDHPLPNTGRVVLTGNPTTAGRWSTGTASPRSIGAA